jgi:hypothetical protein
MVGEEESSPLVDDPLGIDDWERYTDNGNRCPGCGVCACFAASSKDAGIEADDVVVLLSLDATLLPPTPKTFHNDDGLLWSTGHFPELLVVVFCSMISVLMSYFQSITFIYNIDYITSNVLMKNEI